MCNQAAGLSRCLTRVQDVMSTQLKNLHLDKGKSSERTQQAVDEREYLAFIFGNFLTGLSPKPWPEQCRTCLKAFSSAWQTLPLRIETASWNIYMRV